MNNNFTSDRFNSIIIILLLFISILTFSTSLTTGQTGNDFTSFSFNEENEVILIESPRVEYNFELIIITGDIINGSLRVKISRYTSLVTTQFGTFESNRLDPNRTYIFGNDGNAYFVSINFKSFGNNSKASAQYHFEKGNIPFYKLPPQFSFILPFIIVVLIITISVLFKDKVGPKIKDN